jgi:hypothetical protein
MRRIAPIMKNHQKLGETMVARVSERVISHMLQFLVKCGTVAFGSRAALKGCAATEMSVPPNRGRTSTNTWYAVKSPGWSVELNRQVKTGRLKEVKWSL